MHTTKLHAAFAALIAALLMLAPLPAPGQWGAAKNPVSIIVTADPASAPRGGTVTLKIVATVDSKYHLYAMKQDPLPPDEIGPNPTAIALAEANALKLALVGEWKEPAITTKFDKGFERNINFLYGSPLEFTGTFTVPVDAAPGTYAIKGGFSYQACTETSCLNLMEAPFEVSITVTDAPPVAATAPPKAKPAEFVSLDQELDNSGLLAFLIKTFLLGIAALATPCVFPMIPITISFFTNKAAKSRGQAVAYSLVFVLSIIAGFTLIGFGISMLLLAFGGGVAQGGFANQFAANPWVNIAFALMYAFFALTLFEVVHLALPQGLANKFNQKAAAGKGAYAGIFFKAIVFVIVSFTCTAPIVGIAIVDALQGEWTRPLFGMAAFATGFASPFFLLALVPQWIGSLPKAGTWMYATKITMGMLTLALAFKFVSNADLVWLGKEMIFTRQVLLAIWTGIAFATAFYLLGLVKLEADGSQSVGFGRLIAGTTFLVCSLYLCAGLFGSKLAAGIEAYLPPEFESATAVAAGGGKSSAPLPPSRTATGGTEISAGFSWFETVEEAMAHAKKINKPLFLDFTGWSCTNCRLMEKNMFPRPEIAPLLENFVRVKLVTDNRVRGAANREYQATQFGTVTLPFYAVLDTDGKVLAKAEYTTDTERFRQFLSVAQ